jgi:predicted metal-dependent hydrolase
MIPVAIGATVLALMYTSGPQNNVEVKASDGKTYRVQNLPDKQDAAERMSEIRSNLEKIVEHVKQYHEEPYKRLVEKFNPNVLEENDLGAQSTSYSENKGEKIVICLRDKTTAPFPLIELNTVMFVLAHEMAHLMTSSVGHTPEFWTNFRKLLQECIQIGVYTPVNYSKSPVQYCGMTISESPI